MSQPPTLAVRRRSLFGAAAAAAGVAALADPVASSASAAPGKPHPGSLPRDLVRAFAEPGTGTAAGFRWWWPHGLVDPREVAREVDQVADAGFGILEVADVTHSLRARDIEIDLERHGWGSPSWVAGVKAALERGAKRDVRIDITVGPSWPAAVPTITPDDDAACTELAHGRADVAAGSSYDGPVPEPAVPAASAATRRELVAVQAFRDLGTVKAVTTLDRSSLVDLTDQVRDGRLTWTPPADGAWTVLSYWRRGSAQEPEAGPHTNPRSWVVDHFSAAGSDAVVELWQDRVLDKEMRRLLAKAGGYLFEDSLEIETDATIWTPRMLAEFRERAGYDLLPHLPAVVEAHEKYLFAFTDAVATTRVRDDFNQVLSDLYRDHHLLPLQRFARSLGLGLRVQPYGLETDTVEHAALLDVPETESLGFKNLDDYRVMAGGRDMAGHTLLSCEAACYFGAAYNTTWDRALQTLNSIFAAGVNSAVLHGFAYADAPGVTWPGFAAFSPYYDGAVGYGEAWGPRTPQWRHVPDVAAYLARTQLVLQTGVPKYDVVFLRQKGWTSTGIGAPWATNDGIPLGWTHSFATPALLDLPLATVRGGVLAPDGPTYKAVVVGPDQFRGQERTIAVATARRLLELGRAGLPVVLRGDWTTAEPVGLPQDGETAEVRRLVAELAALPTTRAAATDADIPLALAALGVVRDVEHERSTVAHVRRVVGDTDLYYLANAKHAENRRLVRVTQDVWLTSTRGDAVPYLLDAWTGTITPLAAYERQGRRVRVRVDLLPGQSTVVALGAPHPGDRTPAVVASTGDVRRDDRGLLLRAATPGRHTATLAGGRQVATTVARVHEPVVPARWELVVEDWQPGRTATETVRPLRRAELTTLVPWSRVPGLEDVSGVGRYRTVVELDRSWGPEDGALLELGEVNDTFRVTVNGRALPPCDVLDTTVDLGHTLRAGRNVVEVEVTSTLINRLRTVTPEVYGVAARQDYGLVGPVRLVPYVERKLTT
ncbi:glycosyl hydrolase [Nocardioides sp. Arc9.136]|uniref:glycosyl hydrolase n=1 Tax=Nocardioides sp. Arc9.136 TaxID=2996826 RepID=UPI002666B825|nr:glycosyl hydrolase [Nocardioides sp. Arc9.136]WKN47435.1 glycosyl hydrolase [Nocardioides sp. Arc9.136]